MKPVALNFNRLSSPKCGFRVANMWQRNFSTASSRRGFASSVRDKEIEFYSNLNDWWSPDGP